MTIRLISQLLVFALMADALIVCIGQARRRVMWRWIVLYWAILTVKNAFDFSAMF